MIASTSSDVVMLRCSDIVMYDGEWANSQSDGPSWFGDHRPSYCLSKHGPVGCIVGEEISPMKNIRVVRDWWFSIPLAPTGEVVTHFVLGAEHGAAYACTDKGNLYGISMKNGSLLWELSIHAEAVASNIPLGSPEGECGEPPSRTAPLSSPISLFYLIFRVYVALKSPILYIFFAYRSFYVLQGASSPA